MRFVRRVLRFISGLVLGGAVSTAISMLLAPQSGPELQGELKDRAEEARRAGEEAEILETERLKRQFRVAVNDPTALTGKFDRPGAPTQISSGRQAALPAPAPAEDKQAKQVRKKEEAAEKARQQAAKAHEQERKQDEKARQQIGKAQEQEQKADEKAAKADQEVAKKEREAAEARAKAGRS